MGTDVGVCCIVTRGSYEQNSCLIQAEDRVE